MKVTKQSVWAAVKKYAKRYFIDGMSAMALGLFASLIIGLIISQLSQISFLGFLKPMTEVLSASSPVIGAAIGVAIGLGLKEPTLAALCGAATGAYGYSVGGPVGAFVAATVGAEIGRVVTGKTKVDIVIVPLCSIVSGGLITMLVGPAVSAMMTGLGNAINSATVLQPLPMGIIVSVSMTYSWMGGIILGLAGILGLFKFINSIIPAAICAITFLWCAIVMVVQAYRENTPKHYAAVVVAMIPAVADYLYSQITGTAGLANLFTEIQANGLNTFSADVNQQILNAGVMWNGVAELHAGAIVTGLIWGSATAFIIDKRLDKTAIVFGVAAILAFFGFINCSAISIYPTSPFFWSYVILAALCFILNFGKNKWFKSPDDFDYV